MSNALSRLASQKLFIIIFKDYSKLDTFHINYNYFFIQIQMNNFFRIHLIKTYIKNDK